MLTGLKALMAAGAMSAADVLAAGPAMAANPVVAGKLTGATGVVVSGATYNVEFVDGTCGSVFTGCDAASDFTFQTLAGAQAARDALLAQVLLGTYDTTSGLTALHLGVESFIVYVPYGLDSSNVLGASLNNGIGSNSIGNSLSTPESFDLTQFSAARPGPLLAGDGGAGAGELGADAVRLAGIGLAVRRGRRGQALSTAV